MTNFTDKEISDGVSKLVYWLSSANKALGQVSRFSRWINAFGLGIFFLMVCLTSVDVVLRYVFSRPIMGIKEYTEVMLVLVIAFTIAYTYDQKSHVAVDIIAGRFKGKSKVTLETITTLIGIGLFSIVVWRCLDQLIFFFQMGEKHGTAIFIPSAPFQIALVVGSATLLLLLIRDFIRNIIQGIQLHFSNFWWLLILAISIALLVLALLWVQPKMWIMSLPVVGIIGVVSMLVLMFTGLPTSFSLMLAGFLMIAHIRGSTTALNMVGSDIFSNSSNYLWSVAGYFVLMGYLCLFARFGEDVYLTFYRWLGHLRGGLAIATIVASTALAGIVGDALSVTTTMGTIAYPQMRNYKYSDYLSTGTIAAGATLGPLIPPSMGFIIYGILTGESIGKLFIAGIVPGLILATIFVLTITVQCRINPMMGPPGPKSSWGERLISLKYGGPIAALFLLIIGGIYAGVFTATEGGAVGCVGALIIGLIMRRFTRQIFVSALIGAGKIIGMIFLVIIGSMIFSRFIAWCNLSGIILNYMSGLHMSANLVVLYILAIFLVLGCFIDILPMLLIGVPIFHPIAVGLGADPIWFTVMFVMVIQSGVITPPFATILFALKGIIPDVPISTIFKGVLPFCLATVVSVIVLFFIPSLVTWLPSLLYQ